MLLRMMFFIPLQEYKMKSLNFSTVMFDLASYYRTKSKQSLVGLESPICLCK